MINQAAPLPSGIVWSSNSTNTGTVYDSIWGIDQTSTTLSPSPNGSSQYPATKYTGQENCAGATNGSCDATNVVVYYSTIASPAVSSTYYAAGLCKATISGYSDWYLPSICELGYFAGSDPVNSSCGTSGSPTIQNMQSNLVNNGNIGGLSGLFWSSTGYNSGSSSTTNLNNVWYQNFATGGANTQSSADKSTLLGVRCARALTQ